ncbi:hypothetical protein Tco_1438872 [Tanacetum coccineum]
MEGEAARHLRDLADRGGWLSNGSVAGFDIIMRALLGPDIIDEVSFYTLSRSFNPQNHANMLNVIAAGANNRSPMLDKSQHNSWKSYMPLYVQGKENGKQLYDSVIYEPFQYGTVEVPTTPTSLQTTRPELMKISQKQKRFVGRNITIFNLYNLFMFW